MFNVFVIHKRKRKEEIVFKIHIIFTKFRPTVSTGTCSTRTISDLNYEKGFNEETFNKDRDAIRQLNFNLT